MFQTGRWFYNEHRIVKQKGDLGEETLTVDRVDETFHCIIPHLLTWKTQKHHKYEFPLKTVPKWAKTLELQLEQNEAAPRCFRSDFYIELESKGKEEMTEMRALELPLVQNHSSKVPYVVKLHPDDLPGITRPFLLHSIFHESSKGKTSKVRKDLAIPYSITENGIMVYLAEGEKGRKQLGPWTSKPTRNSNLSTILSRVVLMPPAIVLDILFLPVEILLWDGRK